VFRAEKAADKLAQQAASLDHQDRVEAMTEVLGCLVEYLGVRQTTSLMQEASQRLAAEWAAEEKVAAELAGEQEED
jgi:hypothetical protein